MKQNLVVDRFSSIPEQNGSLFKVFRPKTWKRLVAAGVYILIASYKHHRHVYQWSAPFVLALLVSITAYIYMLPNYALSPEVKSIVGSSDSSLVKSGMSYDKVSDTYYLNKNKIGSSDTTNSYSVGGVSPYSLKIATQLSKGVTYYDDKMGLSFSLSPQFKANKAKNFNGQFVYPVGRGNIQEVYTIKANGLKEDLVINKNQGNSISLKYKLNIPDQLQAKMMPSGAIGIYSASPYLYSKISYGSPGDQQKVAKAKVNSDKNYLVFALLPPSIQNSHSSELGTSKLSLNGDTVTLSASGLGHLSYPISIDPSVVVSSASQFGNGNNEGGVNLNTSSNQISESGLSGGDITSWTASTNLFQKDEFGVNLVYNNYIYQIGGNTGSGNTNTVEYAQILSSGALNTSLSSCPAGWTLSGSTWCYSNPGSLTNYDQSTGVVYDGYIYYIAGGTSCTTPVSTVQYAPINSDGSTGTWNTTSSVGTAVCASASVAYNGYIYEFGGTKNAFTNTDTANSYYARVNADGTLGTWNALSVTLSAIYPSGLHNQGMVVNNGYVYLVGGVSGSTNEGNVYYAPINSDGTIGSWVATTSLTGVTATGKWVYGGMSVWDGYIYLVDGNSGGLTNTTYYVNINTNGTLGAWQTADATFSTNYQGGYSVVYNGYLYVLGGDGSGGVGQEAVYAQIKPSGYLGPSSTTGQHAITTGVYDAAEATWNGFLYVAGGSTSGSSFSSNVYYAALGTNGVLGSWTTSSTTLGTAQYGGAGFAADGYLYIGGGQNVSSSETTVLCVALNSNGSLGASFSNCVNNNFGTGFYNSTAVVNNNDVYFIGGYNSVSGILNNVSCSPINPSTGQLNQSGCAATNLPTATDLGIAGSANGYVYYVGGTTNNGSTGITTTEYYAQVTSGGLNTSMSSCASGWTLSGSTWCSKSASGSYTSVYAASGFIYGGYIYSIGGGTSSSQTTTIQYAPLNSDGTIGSWATASTSGLTTAVLMEATASYAGYLYSVGGIQSGTVQTVVSAAQVNNGGINGLPSAWIGGACGSGCYISAAVTAYNGYLYSIGGINGSIAPQTSIEYAPISNTGALGTWNAAGNTGFTATGLEGAVAYNGYMYALGGFGGLAVAAYDQYAPINANGTLGSWTLSANNLFLGVEDEGAVVNNGVITLIGGQSSASGSSGVTTVQYSTIGSNGAPGAWQHNSSFDLPTATSNVSAVVNSGCLYSIGGNTGSGGAATVSTNVYGNSLSSSGIPTNSWSATNPLLYATQGAPVAAVDGYLYVLGGTNTSSTVSSQYATIGLNCTVSNWAPASITGENTSSMGYYNGNLYVLAANSSGAAFTLYTGLNDIPRIGQYSVLLDLTGQSGNDPNPNEILSNGSGNTWVGNAPGGGGITLGYALASDTCTGLSSENYLGAPANNGTYPSHNILGGPLKLSYVTNCSSSDSLSRYVFLRYILDDSNSATFPDVSSSHSTITRAKVYFNAASNYRLRGGKTLNNGTLQNLDASP